MNIPMGYTKGVTSLRVSTYHEIEIGLYQNPTHVPANEHICRQCDAG